MKSQGCMNPTDGPWWAARIIRANTSGGTGSVLKVRMSRREKIAR
jgi:hypothetical protein